MKKLPKPVKLKDFRAGIPYFEVSVCKSGEMYLEEIFVPLGRFYKGVCKFLCFNARTTFDRKKIIDRTYIGDCGLVSPFKIDNLHRTFRYNGKDYEILKDMVKRQDLAAYKELIGAKNK